MVAAVLNEAYERLHFAGPEWGENTLTNHGPMAVETLVRHGYDARVHRWLDHYLRRLDDMPSAGAAVTADNWREALGDGRRIGDWTAYFVREAADQPWRDLLATWWPRLVPGIVAGATHGAIRVGHAVHALLTGGTDDRPAVTELAHALAFWAARWRPVPAAADAAGRLDAGSALSAVPRIPDQNGPVAARLGQLERLPGWTGALAGLRAPRTPDEVRAGLRDLITAGTLHYLDHGQASPVLLVHVATAPNAILRTLPALPPAMWESSLNAVWAAGAALVSAYAPAGPADRSARPAEPRDAGDVFDAAVRHRDEHVIKFSDTALEVFGWTGNRDALTAAAHITTLIDSP
jgi:hypothetical protein